MISIIHELSKLRNEKPVVDYKNNNKYRVIVDEKDGTKTAYYFTTPIYNIKSFKAVDFKFCQQGNVTYASGSNANITIGDSIHLENDEGNCILHNNKVLKRITQQELFYENDLISLTTNGIAYKAKCTIGFPVTFDLEISKSYFGMRTNDKSFSLMSEKYRPFLTVSTIGTLNASEEVIAPASVGFQKLDERKYRLYITPCSHEGEWVLFELNLYDPKLIQDTTVESNNPNTNNAFGTTAFIGNTSQYGEQWLYMRPDFSKFSDLMDKQIQKALLHIPQYNNSNALISAFGVSTRFCSFGSNWNNKISASGRISDTTINGGYQNLDITTLLTDQNTGYIKRSEGLILRQQARGNCAAVVATGDSCYKPQIIEINYK